MKHVGAACRACSAQAVRTDNPAKWKSRYASLIIAGLDICTEEGINEKGLVVNLLFLDGTQYETRNSKRPGIAFYQWPQFYLDNYATVDEVIANLDNVQMVNTALGSEYPNGLPLHVASPMRMANRPSSNSSTASRSCTWTGVPGDDLNEPAYDQQIANMLRYKTFGGTVEEFPGGIQAEDALRARRLYAQVPAQDRRHATSGRQHDEPHQ